MTAEDRWFAGEPNPEDQQYQDHMAAQQNEQYEYEMARQQSVDVVETVIAILSEIRSSAVQRDGVWLRNDAQLARAVSDLANLVIPCLQS